MKNKPSPVHYRQGDVLIERVGSLPKDTKKIARENGRVVLAHGEVTGHAHAITDARCDLFSSESNAGVTFLEVREAVAALKHDEHSTIELPTGNYRVVRQREYSPEAIRNVAD
jgi:hypothetical protein